MNIGLIALILALIVLLAAATVIIVVRRINARRRAADFATILAESNKRAAEASRRAEETRNTIAAREARTSGRRAAHPDTSENTTPDVAAVPAGRHYTAAPAPVVPANMRSAAYVRPRVIQPMYVEPQPDPFYDYGNQLLNAVVAEEIVETIIQDQYQSYDAPVYDAPSYDYSPQVDSTPDYGGFGGDSSSFDSNSGGFGGDSGNF